MSRARARRAAAAGVLLAAALLWTGLTATAHGQADEPAVSIRPADASDTDPGNGQWFALEPGPDGTAGATALVTNVAQIQREVRVFVRDIVFSEGEPRMVEAADAQTGVGRWTQVQRPEFDLGPQETVRVPFEVTVPDDATPGDHIGWVVAEIRDPGGEVEIVRRVATRVYVTVPGEAVRGLTIEEAEADVGPVLWPDSALVRVQLANDGNVRLRPDVAVSDQPASGSELLLSRSSEQYFAEVDVPWWGGIVRFPVRATADGGLERATTVTRVVVPWTLLALVAVAAAAVVLGRRWWHNRHSRYAELQQDIRRLEQLITHGEHDAGAPASSDAGVEQVAALQTALKNARRSGNDGAFARLALALDAAGANALEPLLEALTAEHPAAERELLIDAAARHGVTAMTASRPFAQLDQDTVEELTARAGDAVVDAAPETGQAGGEGTSEKTAGEKTAGEKTAGEKTTGEQTAKKTTKKKTTGKQTSKQTGSKGRSRDTGEQTGGGRSTGEDQTGEGADGGSRGGTQ